MWAEVVLGGLGCFAALAAVWVANSYPLPDNVADLYAQEHGLPIPPGGHPVIPTGVANPVLVLIAVALVMTLLANRRKFGRYVFAIGGNPEAAELGGINVRRTLMLTFTLMGILTAVSAAIQTARLNGATTNLGIQAELDVIAAAVIGGTSFAGGIGTIPGDPGRGRDAVAALRDAPAQRRFAYAGRRRRHRARRCRGLRLLGPTEERAMTSEPHDRGAVRRSGTLGRSGGRPRPACRSSTCGRSA